jgi:transposase, IS5 family
MKPHERRETGEQDLFRSRLDQIIDLRHPLVKLARETDWAFLEQTFGEAYTDGPGQPPLPTRLMAGLIILKYTHNLSDEALCERWVENPYGQKIETAQRRQRSNIVGLGPVLHNKLTVDA